MTYAWTVRINGVTSYVKACKAYTAVNYAIKYQKINFLSGTVEFARGRKIGKKVCDVCNTSYDDDRSECPRAWKHPKVEAV